MCILFEVAPYYLVEESYNEIENHCRYEEIECLTYQGLFFVVDLLCRQE